MEVVWFPCRARVKKSKAEVKLSASAQYPHDFRFSFSHPRGARRALWVCVAAHVCSSIHTARALHGRGSVLAPSQHSRAEASCPSGPIPLWVVAWRSKTGWDRGTTTMWGDGGPRFRSYQRSCRGFGKWSFIPFGTVEGLRQYSSYCGEALAWETWSSAKDPGREWCCKKIDLNREIRRDSCWVVMSYGGKDRLWGRDWKKAKEEERYAASFVQTTMVFWFTLRAVLTQQSQQYGVHGKVVRHVFEPLGLVKEESISCQLHKPRSDTFILLWCAPFHVPPFQFCRPLPTLHMERGLNTLASRFMHPCRKKQVECRMDGTLSATCRS